MINRLFPYKSALLSKTSLFIFSIIVFVFTVGFMQKEVFASSPTANLVSHWKFDENFGTTAMDSSGNNNTGTLTGGAAWSAGKLGNAVQFDGVDDFIKVVASTGNLDIDSGSVTISAWIKPQSVSSVQAILLRGLSDGVAGGQEGYGFFVNSNGKINAGSAGGENYNSLASLTANTWTHVVMIVSSSASKLYINGQDSTPAGAGTVVVASNKDLLIGATRNIANTLNTRFFNGSIDEVRIYNRGLSAQEVTDIYNDTGTPLPTGDTTPPVISSVISSGITQNSASIAWSTNENSDTQVEYGITQSYGQSTGLNFSLLTSHGASLSALTTNTTYNYRVKSRDAAGNLAVSTNQTFTTAAIAVSAPTISSFTASPTSITSGQSSTLSWSVTNATSISINQSIGTVTGTSRSVSPTVTTTYTLTATNAQSSVTSSAMVTVGGVLPPVSGNVFYVAPNVSTGGNGSITNPWNMSGLSTNKASIPAGSTVYLRGGRYIGNFDISLNGTVTAPIKITSYPGEWAVIDGYDPSVTLTSSVGINGSNSTSITATVSDASKLKRGGGQSLDNEEIYIKNIQGNTITFLRGWGGSAIVPHSVGAIIQQHRGTVIAATGSHTWFMDFEVMSSDPVRQTSISGSGPSDIFRSSGIDINGDGIKLINLVIHDVVNGIFTFDTAKDVEVSGVITYSNGWWAPDRGHGHGMYLRNGSGTLHNYNDIISFDNHATGQKVFGYSAHGENVHLDGFVGFNNVEGNFLIGVSTFPMKDISVKNSYLYSPNNTNGRKGGYGMRFGFGNTENLDLVLENNYIAGRSNNLDIGLFQTVRVTGNTIWSSGNGIGSTMVTIKPGTGSTVSNYTIDNNTYFDNDYGNITYNFGYPAGKNTLGGNNYNYTLDWKRLTPFDVNSTYVRGTARGIPNVDKHFVRPNAYENGRANIIVYNWSQANSVSINVASAGLSVGDSYEVRDVQNYFGTPVLTGVYNGSPITVPMTSTAMYQAVGNVFFPPVHTSKEFGVFVLKKVGGSIIPPVGDTTPPSTPTNLSTTVFSGTIINLSWTASTDNTAVTGYKVFRNGTQVGTTATNSFSDTGLSAATTYTYTVSAFDAEGNTSSLSTSVSVITQSSLPVISNLLGSNTTATSTTISWQTNTTTNGQVDYGLTTSYGLQSAIVDNSPKTLSHTITLTNLTPSTLYHFRARSIDALNQQTQTTNFTFTTPGLPPVGDTTAPSVVLTTPTIGQTISGNVTVTANASDNTGVVGVQFKLDGINLGAEDLTSPYSVVFNTGQSTNGSHNLSAVARDAVGNTATSTPVVITVNNATVDVTPPVLSGITVSLVRWSTAQITWITDELSDSLIEYGLTTAYASSTPTNPTLVLSHTMKLSTLIPNQTYHFRVKSKDQTGNVTTSPNFTFTTKARLNKPPKLSNVTITAGSVKIGWGLADYDLCKSIEIYRSTSAFVLIPNEGAKITTLPCNAIKYDDTNVNNSTLYYYSIFVVDDLGVYSEPLTVSFTTPATHPTSSIGGAGTPPVIVYIPPTQAVNTIQSNTTTTQPSIATPASVQYIFKTILAIGMRNSDVKNLQQILGIEQTGYFGVLTQKALGAFQVQNNIAQPGEEGYGQAGPKTRSALNTLGGVQSQTGTTPPTTGGSTTFTVLLKFGSKTDQVRILQKILVKDPALYPEGLITGYFGSATVRAVQKFQVKYGIASPGKPGYGQVGPKTRATLNQLGQ